MNRPWDGIGVAIESPKITALSLMLNAPKWISAAEQFTRESCQGVFLKLV